MERAFVVSALEGLTTIALETEFKWTTSAAGFAVGLSFLGSIPITFLAGVLRKNGWLSDLGFMQVAACASMVASILLFPQLGNALPNPSVAGPALILVADAIIFSNGYLANGVMDGLAIQSASPEESTFFHSEYFYIVSQSLQCYVGRFLGPPVARATFDRYDRTAYAGLQLAMSSLGVIACFGVATAVQRGFKKPQFRQF